MPHWLRLGYPIKLVCTKRHLFCRWDDPQTGIQLNIEGAGDGFGIFPDEHYRGWPCPITAEEEQRYGFLKSMTPRREMASFIGKRAFRLLDAHQYKESVETFIIASELDSAHAMYPSCILGAMTEWRRNMQSQFPLGLPKQIEVLLRRDRRRWPSIPWEVERQIAFLHATEWCLNYPSHVEMWWQPLRQGRRPARSVPTRISVDYEQIARR